MDCTECEELLDVLLRGELPARREAAVRAHLATCQSCRAKHMRRLRIAELNAAALPSPAAQRFAWTRRVWRWLRPQARGVNQVTPQAGASVRLGLLGRMPMVPQVATGTVMLLIVLVGLWSLPQLTRTHTVHRFTQHAESEPIRAIQAGAPDETRDSRETSTHAVRTPKPQLTAAGSPAPSAAESEARRKDDLEAGLSHFRAHEYAQATPLLSRALASSSTGSDQAMTLLYLARAERALGHCDRAVNSYTTLVRVHPTKAEALAALREGVACYDDMSEPGHAQHLLEQAAATRGLAEGARSLLAQRANGGRKPTGVRPTSSHTH